MSQNLRIFISASSRDYPQATRVWEYLRGRGIEAFFSEKTLPRLGSGDYRKQIDRALDAAEHLIVVTSSRENVEAGWVEAEWGLFLNEKRSGRKQGNLIPVVCGGMEIAELPASLRYFQALALATELERLPDYLGPVRAERSETAPARSAPARPGDSGPRVAGRGGAPGGTDARERSRVLPNGHRVGPYMIVKRIGEDWQSIRYLADFNAAGRTVVIDEIIPTGEFRRGADGGIQLAEAEEADRAYFEETQAAFSDAVAFVRGLRCPNFPRYQETLRLNRTTYLVADFEGGCFCGDWIRGIEPPAREVDLRGILVPLLGALRVLHEASRLHCGIRPREIYLPDLTLQPLDEDRHPMLFGLGLDFGGLRQDNIVTPGYSAWELYEGDKQARCDGRADLYSLAAVMYKALTGDKPPDVVERINAMRAGRADPLQASWQRVRGAPGLSRRFLETIWRALAIKKEDRYRDAEAWLAALR